MYIYIFIYVHTHIYIYIYTHIAVLKALYYIFNPVIVIAIQWIIAHWFRKQIIPYALGIEYSLCVTTCMAAFLLYFVFVVPSLWRCVCIVLVNTGETCSALLCLPTFGFGLGYICVALAVGIHILGCSEWCLCPAKFHVSRFNSSPPGQNSRHLADDNLKFIHLKENDGIPIRISLKFVSKSPIENKPALSQVMAWRRTGDKPLPEPMLTRFTDAYMRH